MSTRARAEAPSLRRIVLLMRNRAYDDAPGLGIVLAIVVGVNLLSLLFEGRAFMNGDNPLYYFAMIVVTGLLLSGQAFKGMHGRPGCDWILFPATPFEKYLAVVLSYVILFPVVASGAAIGVSAVLALLEGAASGSGGRVWHPFTMDALRLYGEYAVVAPAFIAGSAAFRRRSFLKTIGLSVGFVFSCAALVFLGLYLAYGSSGDRGFIVSYDTGSLTVAGTEVVDADSIERILRALVDGVRLVLVPVFSLVYGYLRVVEKEARDEVQ